MTKARPRKNVLLTGRPGTGKTTVVRKVLERLGVRAGGFFTEEIRERGERVGFNIVTTGGREDILAHVTLSSRHRVGKYRVSTEAMDRIGAPALLGALEGAPLIVIDEIAKMELLSEQFKDAVIRCLDSLTPVLAVIQMSDLPFLNQIRARPDVELVEVTAANRDTLPEEIIRRLKALLL